ncbi:hypothetical protein PG437_003157 [Salmonella enterica]|nr:hypothetical protein [Salmonella enterica]
MMRFKQNYFWHVSVIILGLAIGLVHHIYIYPHFFHADSAAYQVLASAIKDEGSLLPRDFIYGNQLIMLKISPFIALASSIGFIGYKAYAIGGALAICFWFYVCSIITSKYFKSNTLAVVLTTCLFIPFGIDDIDFLLGQESHLSNVVLSIMICLPIIMYIQEDKKAYLALSALATFLMTSESPIRSLIVLAPFILFIAIVFSFRKSFISISVVTIAFLLGKASNSCLLSTHFPLKVDYSQLSSLIAPGSVIDNLLNIFKSILVRSSSADLSSGFNVSSLLTPFYFLGLLYIVLLIVALSYGLKVFIELMIHKTSTQPAFSREGLLCALGAVGFIFGLILVASLNPDSGRHIFWATCLLKISVFSIVYIVISRYISKNTIALTLTLLVALGMSALPSTFYETKLKPFNYAKLNINSDINKKIKETVKSTGIKYIYGEDFWRMQLLNSMDFDVHSAELTEFHMKGVIPRDWLTRPSWYCKNEDVLYYTKNGITDSIIVSLLKANGGELIYESNEGSIWKGPVIWNTPAWCN